MIEQELALRLTQNIQRTLDSSIQDMIRQSIDALIMDPAWIEKIQAQIDQSMTSLILQHLSTVDLNLVIQQQAHTALEGLRQQLRQELTGPGIRDDSTRLELTVMDGAVVIENSMISREARVMGTMQVDGALTVNDFVVRGVINTDNPSWTELTNVVHRRTLDSLTAEWRQQLVDQVLAQARDSGIDFAQVTVDGHALVSGSELAPTIELSSLRRVGSLEDLSVLGPADFCGTMTVKPRRVGINTNDPEMALSIWDEEVTVYAGKLSQDRAYIGTGRRQNLALGVDRKPALEIDTQGLVTVRSLRLDRFRIAHNTESPGTSGTRGDIMFNSDPRPGTPFAWVCLGAFRWQSIGSIG